MHVNVMVKVRVRSPPQLLCAFASAITAAYSRTSLKSELMGAWMGRTTDFSAGG